MDEFAWQCCRFCLSNQELHPIFSLPEHSEKYTNTIYDATGLKVEITDTLPHQVCTSCIMFINKSIKFRKKCLEALKNFENKVSIKIDAESTVNETSIDINHLLDEFDDYDDNITLDTYRFNDTQEKIEKDDKYDIDIVIKVKEDEEFDKLITNINNMKKDENKRRGRTKVKDKGKEKAREEIECEYCHKILTSKLSLRNHYKIHTGFDIVCEHCGKKFITRRLLLMHCRAKHGYEKTDKCSYCDYKASNAEQVKIHERLHTGEKPFVCKECGAGFHRKSSYLQHVAIHLPEKTVQCEQCPARFKSVTLMRIHASRHRAPRYAFHCGLCGGAFARRRNVARHLTRVHASIGDHHIQRHKIH